MPKEIYTKLVLLITGLFLVVSIGCSSAPAAPVEVIKEVPVEVVKEVPVEVIKEVPVEVVKEVEVIKEVPVAATMQAVEKPGKLGGELKVGGYAKPKHFDIQQSTTVNNLMPQGYIYNTLLRFTPESDGEEIGPDLAMSWEVSDDGKDYTLNLREGVTFHDGSAFSAEDVVATYDRIINPPDGVLSMRQYMFGDVTGVNAVDDLTVKFSLKKPQVTFAKNLASGWNVIYSKENLEENNFNLRETGLDAPGTGPFKIGDYEIGEYYGTVKFADYWDEGKPYLDAVTHYKMGNEATKLAALLAGEIDVAIPIPPADEAMIKKSHPEITTSHVAYFNFTLFQFNQNRAPFDDVRVRKAILLAYDQVTHNYSDTSWMCGTTGGWMPHACQMGSWDRSESILRGTPGFRKPTEDDLAEARQLMKDAGFAEGSTITVLGRGTKSGDSFAFQADHLKRVLNINVEVEGVDGSTFYDLATSGDFDVALFGGGGTAFDDPSEIWDKYLLPGAGQNYGSFDNSEVTQRLADIRGELDEAKRRQLVMDTHSLLDEHIPYIPSRWQGRVFAWSSDVKGLIPDPRIVKGLYNAPVMRAWEWAWLDR